MNTSTEAYISIKSTASSMREQIHSFLKLCSTGATCDSLEHVLGMRHQTCSARIRELVLNGSIKDSGERRPTRSGRNARVYKVVES